MIEVQVYQTARGKQPYMDWLAKLNVQARLKVITAVGRLEEGNTSNLKGLGGGVSELKINFGPGYRVYLGRQDGTFALLLGGGTKKRQSEDIATAKKHWQNYLAERKG